MTVIADIRTGAKTALDNTTGLSQTYSARPAGIGSLPAGWVDLESLDWVHDSGTRQWSGSVDVVIVTQAWDNEEGQAGLEALASALVDYVSDHPHLMGANTVVEPVRMRGTSVSIGDNVTLPAVVVTIGSLVFQEGR